MATAVDGTEFPEARQVSAILLGCRVGGDALAGEREISLKDNQENNSLFSSSLQLNSFDGPSIINHHSTNRASDGDAIKLEWIE